ncbi:hypothetical protein [Roseovarius mucosus]|uniref:hypothetical protein n=1 Tax=Roseovarius mucosus TaxID=215743 RepID=UPI003BAC6E84
MSNVVAMTPPGQKTVTVRVKRTESGKKFANKFNGLKINEIREAEHLMLVQLERKLEERQEPFSDVELAKFFMSLMKAKIDTVDINRLIEKMVEKWPKVLPKRHLSAALNFAESEWSAMGVANDKAKGEANVFGTFGFTDLASYAYNKITETNRVYTPVIYNHGREIVRVVKNKKTGKDEMDILNPRSFRPIVNAHAPFFKEEGGALQSISAPMDVVEELFHGDYPFAELNQIAFTPVFAPDGALIEMDGYDEETGIYLSLPSDLRIPKVPKHPTQLDIDNALEKLLDLFGDFPFDGEKCRPGGKTLEADEVPASMANMLAALLTPFCRPMIRGPLPLAFVSKPKVATGASLLAEGLYRLAAGISEPSAAFPSTEEERGKVIFSAQRQQKPYLWFDNVSGEITSDTLAVVLTARIFEGRVLGQSRMATVDVNSMPVMTSNNARLNEDLKRRSFLIRLDAQMENPKFRTGFKYNLSNEIEKRRGELLCAALTLIQAWVSRGMLAPQEAPHMASYDEWVRVLGGILETAGIKTFLTNEDVKDSVASINEDQGINDLIAVWWEKAQDPKQTGVSDKMLVGTDEGLVGLCLAEDIELEGVKRTRKDMDLVYDATALGKFLAQYADAYFNVDGTEVRLHKAGTRDRRVVWKLTPKEEEQDSL